jgi:hypothetical protein
MHEPDRTLDITLYLLAAGQPRLLRQQMRQWFVRDSAAILTCSAGCSWRALAAEAPVGTSQITTAESADQLKARETLHERGWSSSCRIMHPGSAAQPARGQTCSCSANTFSLG